MFLLALATLLTQPTLAAASPGSYILQVREPFAACETEVNKTLARTGGSIVTSSADGLFFVVLADENAACDLERLPCVSEFWAQHEQSPQPRVGRAN